MNVSTLPVVLQVIFSAGGESRREGAGGNILTYTILNLLPNTEYTVEVLALTSAGEGPATSSFTRTTGFGGKKKKRKRNKEKEKKKREGEEGREMEGEQ